MTWKKWRRSYDCRVDEVDDIFQFDLLRLKIIHRRMRMIFARRWFICGELVFLVANRAINSMTTAVQSWTIGMEINSTRRSTTVTTSRTIHFVTVAAVSSAVTVTISTVSVTRPSYWTIPTTSWSIEFVVPIIRRSRRIPDAKKNESIKNSFLSFLYFNFQNSLIIVDFFSPVNQNFDNMKYRRE